MKDKLVDMVKKYWVIPASVLLWYYPILPLGLGICSIIVLTTGSECISVVVSMVGIGAVSSILIILKLKKVTHLKKRIRHILTLISIIFFALLSYYVGIVMM